MKTQIIKTGNHYTNWWQRRFMLAPKSFDVEIYLDKSLWYSCKNKDSEDVNKLFGQSFGDHRQNSLRIGWVPDFDDMDFVNLYWYSTVDGADSNNQSMLGYFKLNQTIKFNWERSIVQLIDFDDEGPSIVSWGTFFHPSTQGLSYVLNPYFGGNNKAPHKITIKSKISNRKYF